MGSMEKAFTKEEAQAKDRTKARHGNRERCEGMRGQGKGMKGNSSGQGWFVCGDTSRWRRERSGKMSAVTDDDNQQEIQQGE